MNGSDKSTEIQNILANDKRFAVMSIINRTDDSFYDKGATFALDAALRAGERAFSEGADIVDVGG